MAHRYESLRSIPRVRKKEFEAQIRELSLDKRAKLDPTLRWTVRTEHAVWMEFLRETAPMHCLYEKLRSVSITTVLHNIEAVIGEPPAVLSCRVGSELAVLFQSHDVLCILNRDGMTLYSSNIALLHRIVEAEVTPKVSVAKSVSLLTVGHRGVAINFAGSIDRPLSEFNYTPEVQKQIREVADWAERPDPFGRIVIFAGPPGTGKSFAVRALVTETECVEWVIVPPSLVPRLASPDLVQVLIDERNEEGPLGLIVEDADTLLRERASGNDENVVAQILNLGEGITGDIADLRIVLTTNVARLQIDKALLRKGRLFKFVQFDKLEPDRAAALYKHLTGRDHEFREPIPLSDVYGLANDHDTNVKEPSSDGFGQYA